jgi:hypothetical protein
MTPCKPNFPTFQNGNGGSSEVGQFQDLAWTGFQRESILEFPGIGVQLIDHLPLIPKTRLHSRFWIHMQESKSIPASKFDSNF